MVLAACLLASTLATGQGEACFLWPPLQRPFQPNGLMQPYGQQQMPYGQQLPFNQQQLPFNQQQQQQQPFGQNNLLPDNLQNPRQILPNQG